jgi:glutathione S-transferase
MSRVLYHFFHSTFSRRARLALAHKGIDVELCDTREEPHRMAEAQAGTAVRTMPVLVDEGRVVAESLAIAHYLDLAYPERPRLFPLGAAAAAETLAITSAVDIAMNTLVDVGTRYWPLHDDPAWASVVRDRMERAQLAIDSVAAKATRPILVGDAWGIAEICTIAATKWVAGMPARVPTSPRLQQIRTLGFRLPDALTEWAKLHDDRPEVRAIYG